MSSLFKTAQAELQRKSSQLQAVRSELWQLKGAGNTANGSKTPGGHTPGQSSQAAFQRSRIHNKPDPSPFRPLQKHQATAAKQRHLESNTQALEHHPCEDQSIQLQDTEPFCDITNVTSTASDRHHTPEAAKRSHEKPHHQSQEQVHHSGAPHTPADYQRSHNAHRRAQVSGRHASASKRSGQDQHEQDVQNSADGMYHAHDSRQRTEPRHDASRAPQTAPQRRDAGTHGADRYPSSEPTRQNDTRDSRDRWPASGRKRVFGSNACMRSMDDQWAAKGENGHHRHANKHGDNARRPISPGSHTKRARQ